MEFDETSKTLFIFMATLQCYLPLYKSSDRSDIPKSPNPIPLSEEVEPLNLPFKDGEVL
jgi:hypothetical protein